MVAALHRKVGDYVVLAIMAQGTSEAETSNNVVPFIHEA